MEPGFMPVWGDHDQPLLSSGSVPIVLVLERWGNHVLKGKNIFYSYLCKWYFIHPSIHASIHPSIHPSMHTYVHTYILVCLQTFHSRSKHSILTIPRYGNLQGILEYYDWKLNYIHTYIYVYGWYILGMEYIFFYRNKGFGQQASWPISSPHL